MRRGRPAAAEAALVGQPWTEATLRAAQAALQSARLNLGYTQVRAPVGSLSGGEKARLLLARAAATTPARVLGLGASVGQIAPGYQADLVHLDDDLQVVAVLAHDQL